MNEPTNDDLIDNDQCSTISNSNHIENISTSDLPNSEKQIPNSMSSISLISLSSSDSSDILSQQIKLQVSFSIF